MPTCTGFTVLSLSSLPTFKTLFSSLAPCSSDESRSPVTFDGLTCCWLIRLHDVSDTSDLWKTFPWATQVICINASPCFGVYGLVSVLNNIGADSYQISHMEDTMQSSHIHSQHVITEKRRWLTMSHVQCC